MIKISDQPRPFIRAGLLLLATLGTALGGALLLPTFAQQNEFPGEKIVHLLQEPRHRTVHHEGDLYLLDVQVNPGDISFPHIHDQAILLTRISTAEGLSGGVVGSNTDYASQSLTHKVSNDGPGLLRILALVNDGDGNPDLQADRPTGLSMEPELENAWFRSYRIELAPGEATAMQTHSLASIVVQATEGVFHVTRSDGITNELDAPADWAWRKADERYLIRNVGTNVASVVINEGRH